IKFSDYCNNIHFLLIIKNINPMAQNTILIKCWLLTLTNGKLIGFNAHDQDIVINNLKYYSNSSEVSAIVQSLDNPHNSFEFRTILNHEAIKLSEVMAGLYDNAWVEIFLIDLNNQDKKIWTQKGLISEIKI
ncbi:MAG: DUF2163 domain-containing protein, partial [Candidatus Midichloria sp.]|nr:DUF2163 domain-containing protein [Candidatus Midichloria sp.]